MPRAVAGCTNLIEAATESHHLAIAYRNRSSAYAALGEFERAEQDYEQAITLNLGYMTAPSEGLFAASRRRD
jgi:tetratricopeptide (TPR) repeat protein